MKKLFPVVDTIIGSLIFFLVFSGTMVFWGCAKSPHSIDSLTTEQEFEKFDKLFNEGKAFYTLDEAIKIVIELMPKIEKLAGKKFISMPKIRMIDAAEAENIFKQKKSIPHNNSSIESRSHLSGNEEKLLQLMSKTIGGIYEPKYKRLNLIPTHIEPMLRLMGLGYKHGMLLSKMTIAHELTHALQDQHIDLDRKMEKAPGAEEQYALAATIEGHADFIKREIGKQLGVRYYESDKSKSLEFKNPLLKKLTSPESPYILKYTEGRKFIDYHFKKGGNHLLWKILENPPVDTSMIMYPETYIPKPYDTFDYRAVLDDVYDFSTVDKNTQKIKFEYNNFSLSKFSIREIFSDLKMPDKYNIISKIRHHQNLNVKYNDITFVKIGFVVLESGQYAPHYINLEQKYVTQKVDELFSDMHNNYLCKNHTIEIAKEITTHEKVKTWYAQEKIVKRKYALLAKNNMIVTYSDMVFWLDDCEILKIAQKIFTRYENSRKNGE